MTDDNINNRDPEAEAPGPYEAETQVYDAEPPVQNYSADDFATPALLGGATGRMAGGAIAREFG